MSYVYLFIAIVPSIVLHEVSHGYVALLFGDTTAKDQHRLTLNPLRHIDPFGTVLLPALLLISGLPAFGYAKPVPVNVSRLRRPRSQSLYVSLAGPLVNVVLSGVGFAISEFALHVSHSQVTLNIGVSLGLVNLMLAVFNMLPIPPLDGSAVIERFIPVRALPRYYQLRARALPIVMAIVILDSFFFHFGGSALSGLQQWWLSRLF